MPKKFDLWTSVPVTLSVLNVDSEFNKKIRIEDMQIFSGTCFEARANDYISSGWAKCL